VASRTPPGTAKPPVTSSRGEGALNAEAVIAGAAETPYSRHPEPAETSTESLLADAFLRALESAGIDRDDVDGLGVASFTLTPDHAVDLAWRLGVRPRWLMDDANGGSSGITMLQHAVRAVESRDAETVVLLAGDRLLREEFATVVDGYNRATRDHLAEIPVDGPNTAFALLTQRHMARTGLEREDYGLIPLAQRRWAAENPLAVYRGPLTMEDYLAARIVADPLCLYDCPPVVSGADALVITSRENARSGVRIRSVKALHNADGQEGDGLTTPLGLIAADLWEASGQGPAEVDLAYVYDDYPVMVLVQLADLGFIEDGDIRRFLRVRLGEERWPLNTSGGQLSCGQAGAGGGMHGLVEAVTQLLGKGGDRQVEGARTAVVTGYGMVLYRYGASAGAVVLEAGKA
jgi:acetyl-CoA acetyltransferase